jgi:acetoin utilization deacetylase AcuC-like enzyme
VSLSQSYVTHSSITFRVLVCPGSLDAIQGALGTVCEAVDVVLDVQSPIDRAFVAIRPPGHHCGEDTPSGFCFVNNVAVAAAHGASYSSYLCLSLFLTSSC